MLGALSKTTGDREGQVASLTNLGYAYSSSGNYAQAIDCYKQALEIIDCYKQALEIAEKISFLRVEGTVLGNLGSVFFALGDCKRTIELYKKALDIWRQIRNKESEALTLDNLGKAYCALRDYEKALEYNQQHLAIVKAMFQQLRRAS